MLLHDSAPTTFLSVHFSLTPALAIPLYWLVGGAWALLLLQLGAVLAGALGVRRYARAHGATPGEANLALAFFSSQWGIFLALGFDYHDNVVGAMALPWLAMWVGQRRWGAAVVAGLLMLVSKENMALWLIFVLLGLAWQYRQQRHMAMGPGLAALGAAGYFLLITHWAMPALDMAQRPFNQLVRYRHWGTSVAGILDAMLTHPGQLVQGLFLNTIPDPDYNYVKSELWLALLCSGGLLLIRRPWYALMLLPVWPKSCSQTMAACGASTRSILSNLRRCWPWPLPMRSALGRWDRLGGIWGGWPWRAWWLAFTIVTLYTRQSKSYDRTTTNFLLGRHYRSLYDRAALRAALSQVPAKAILSAQSNLVPHLPGPHRI